MRLPVIAAFLLSSLVPAAPVFAAPASPSLSKVGQCVTTRIKLITTRLEDVADSGDAIEYANGIWGMSYGQDPALRTARKGDPVKLCLTSIPRNCPKGDDRGKTYRASDLRTHKSWAMPDAEHMCGGA